MSLRVITGPMYSGKTSELLRRIKKYKISKKKYFIIKYSKDNRYDKKKVCTHDNGPCEFNVQTNNLMSLKDNIKGYDIIIEALKRAHESVKVAIVMIKVNVDYNRALDLVEGADGFVRRAIEDKI